MKKIFEKKGTDRILFQGNEAIARGALEAGVRFCSGYPGNPSSEIIETLGESTKYLPVYAEWSINEKVAVEAAAAASFSGLRSIVCMKQCGLNVASDFLVNLTLSGTKGGFVLVTCDDPSGISSTNEEDARAFAPLTDVPLLEPSTPQEALDMVKWAFELSEEIGNIVFVRSVSRLSHTRSVVTTHDLPEFETTARFDNSGSFHTFPIVPKHHGRHGKLDKAASLFEASSFNVYKGPEKPELLVISCGSTFKYAREAAEILELQEKVGVVKLGTTFPLPRTFLKTHLEKCDRILFAEEVDPFVETNIKAFYADMAAEIGPRQFMGKASGHIPAAGELNPEILIDALGNIFDVTTEDRKKKAEYQAKANQALSEKMIGRDLGFCPGCPHRGSFYAIKTALAYDDRDGFVSGDIGCYTLGIFPTGYQQVKSVHAMGSGLGLASGYGKLGRFGFDQPVITVCGDSTFFHAGLPALINAKFNKSDILLLVLDNRATAMTGFQPHPGIDKTLMGEPTEPADIEALAQSLGVYVDVADPYEPLKAAEKIYDMLRREGTRVLIMRRNCALVQGKKGGFPYKMQVNTDLCLGESCGCGRYCTRIFRCPGLIWNKETQKAAIDEVVCVGCGLCSSICPNSAIERKEKGE